MPNQHAKNVFQYVVPTMLSNVCFFLFTVVDGIFVGNGIGTNGLGAVNIVLPFTMIVAALFMLASIGGVTVFAIRLC
ncbi:MAG: MATE family efflux transporter [Eubacteriales bacterium]|nr:MATE family efflux transporter [Eubacteriales bacterium]